MESWTENARTLKEGIEKTGRFDIVSKDVGVPLVAFSLKDSSKYTVFQISENLRRFGWIVPAYTMPPNAERIAVLRVVIREDFSRTLAERLVTDIDRVLKEMDEFASSHVSTKAAHVTATVDETQDGRKNVEKSVRETEEEVINTWRRFVRSRKSGAC
ncbi:glutamate decarboxylase-like [Corylus avellana]|uniref:glutamate decarboxylase-like n=1 Tax=Corylus avellana TaxID=13451 RepID=UPI00286C826F|nr:glutamate decarboxylase-like [Corylus avellana]